MSASDLLVIGMSHRSSPVALRERLAVEGEALVGAVRGLVEQTHLSEALLLSTCNRVEIYAGTDERGIGAELRRWLADRAGETVDGFLYEHRGEDATRHAFRVASSLDSMVVGEPQILGQVKEAFAAAKAAGVCGGLLERCLTTAFGVAKRVRSETEIAAGSVSVSSVASDLARKIFGDLEGRRVLLVGAGEMGEQAAKHLKKSGASLYVVNRSREKADALANEHGGHAQNLEALATELAHADVVIASTSSQRFVITHELMRGVTKARRHRPLFLIDIAVPRDVDPRVGDMDNVFLYDVDDLSKVAEENLSARQREAEKAEAIVARGGAGVREMAAHEPAHPDHRRAARACARRAERRARADPAPPGRAQRRRAALAGEDDRRDDEQATAPGHLRAEGRRRHAGRQGPVGGHAAPLRPRDRAPPRRAGGRRLDGAPAWEGGVVKIRIATRKSPLALAQTRWVAERIRAHRPDVEIEEVLVMTKGDIVIDKPLAKIGGKGLFISEVEATLLDGRAELAVHSMKDVPDELAEEMAILCVPEREDPRDVLVTPDGRELSELTRGATIGTSSLRRSCQLRAARPDVAFAVLRGNVGTRLSKLDRGDFDAIVLAYAGMKRLELDRERPLWAIPPETSIPAVGQGALGIEGRADDPELLALLAPLEHGPTRLAVEAERGYLSRLQGSCTTPIAAFARFDDDGETRMRVDGMVGSVDGDEVLNASVDGYVDARDHAERLQQAMRKGVELAEMMLDRGAAELIARAKSAEDPYKMGPYGRLH